MKWQVCHGETMSKDVFFRTLSEQCYVHVPFKVPHGAVDLAVAAFFRFLQAPAAIKTHIDFSIAPLHRRGDVGYKHRLATDDIYNDDKEFFHYHPAIESHYADFLCENPVVADLIQRARPLWDATATTVRETLTRFEKHSPGIVNRVFDTTNPHILLRFLKYDWTDSGRNLAKPHFDAGSCTLAIAESTQGLRIGRDADTLSLVNHRPGQAIFMFSSNYRQLLQNDAFQPGWHDVIQIDDTLKGRPFSRWAIVAFIEAHGVKALSRNETHKWALNG